MSNKKVEIDQKIRDQMKGGTHDVLILGPGFDYKSPIEIFKTDTLIQNVNEAMDNAVYRAVINADIKVDRGELIKALQYDRGQYEKGFTDGRLYKPPLETNGDKIRAMTDEELADFLGYSNCPPEHKGCQPETHMHMSCSGCWLWHIRSEVDKEEVQS